MLAKIICLFILQNLASNVESIYGGTPVTDSQFPWIVQIIQDYTDFDYMIPISTCGGSIISKNVIMTAAHCVYEDHVHGSFGERLVNFRGNICFNLTKYF